MSRCCSLPPGAHGGAHLGLLRPPTGGAGGAVLRWGWAAGSPPGWSRGARAGGRVGRGRRPPARPRRWGPPAGRAGQNARCAPGPAPAHAQRPRQRHQRRRRRSRARRQECGTGARAEAAQDGAGPRAAGSLRGALARQGGRSGSRPGISGGRASRPWPRSGGGPSWSCCSGRGTQDAPTAAPRVGAAGRVPPGSRPVRVGAGPG